MNSEIIFNNIKKPIILEDRSDRRESSWFPSVKHNGPVLSKDHGIRMQITWSFLQCYSFSNLRVANFAVISVTLESAMQGDALRNQWPNLPLIYARHNNAPLDSAFREIKSFPWSPSNNARPRLDAHVMSHEWCVPTRLSEQFTWTIYMRKAHVGTWQV